MPVGDTTLVLSIPAIRCGDDTYNSVRSQIQLVLMLCVFLVVQWLVLFLFLLIIDTLGLPIALFIFLRKNKTRIENNDPKFKAQFGILTGTLRLWWPPTQLSVAEPYNLKLTGPRSVSQEWEVRAATHLSHRLTFRPGGDPPEKKLDRAVRRVPLSLQRA